MTWLVTGGAGYIGAHVLRALRAAGLAVAVLDDLSTGQAQKVPTGVPLVRTTVLDRDGVAAALLAHDVEGVVHLAAKKAVGESVERPYWYYRENVDGLLTLLEACHEAGVRKFVYSSSAAVYGDPANVPVTESEPLIPVSPYGETKIVGEWLLRDASVAFGTDVVSLRYFNVVGAGAPDLGDPGVFNLVPLALRAITSGRRPQIYGDDYPTRDGTCIRDYVHVADLADAHAVAAGVLQGAGPGGYRVYNVGRGEGFTVREVLTEVLQVTGSDLEPDVVARRPGDPPSTVADVSSIRDDLGWVARYGLPEMVRSAWDAWPRD
jgi:UDP-glucose 4-epimerase